MRKRRMRIAAAALAVAVAVSGQYTVPVFAAEQQGDSTEPQGQAEEPGEGGLEPAAVELIDNEGDSAEPQGQAEEPGEGSSEPAAVELIDNEGDSAEPQGQAEEPGEGGSESAAVELIDNGSFEEEGALESDWQKNDWCCDQGAAMSIVNTEMIEGIPEGEKCLRETSKSKGSQVTQEVETTEGKEYWLSAQINQSSAGTYTIGVQTNEGKDGDGQAHTEKLETTNEWTGVAVRFTMWGEEEADKTNVYTWLSGTNTTAYLDDVSLTEAPDYSPLEEAVQAAKTKLEEKPATDAGAEWATLQEKCTEAEGLLDEHSYESSQMSQEDVNGKVTALKDATAAVDTGDDTDDGDQTEVKNYLKNPDFTKGENGLQDWGKWPNDANVTVGGESNDKYVSITYSSSNGNGAGINQNVSGLKEGKWYELSGKVCADTVCALGLEFKPNNSVNDKVQVVNSEVETGDEWEEVSLLFKATSASESNNVAVWLTEGTAKVKDLVLTDAEEPKATGETYYIDAQGGNDNNAGTSEDQAWKSFTNLQNIRLREGAAVLLKAGCTWNNEKLHIVGAQGSRENPVRIGRYGDGADPIINGNGSPWQKNENAPKEDVAVVHIENSSNIVVENLEVTNWEKEEADLQEAGTNNPPETGIVSTPTKRQSKYMLTGILVENHDQGELDGVIVRNNKVHDVNGRMYGEAKKGTGGIVALVTGSAKASSFTNLQITGNEVYNVCHQGIYMESSWASRPLVLKNDSQKPGAGQGTWEGWKDVTVSDNYVHNVAGDGIVLINADGGIAEHNLVVASADEDWNYMANKAHAALWMWDCNNVTMQYNESANTESYQDGMSFDFDYGNQNVLYQYNYSHGNKGGFWMSCPGPAYTVNAVARYNISINDGLFDGARMIRVGEKGSVGNQFYNNTMYWDHDYEINAIEAGSWGTRGTSGTDIFNNIFYGDSDMVIADENVHYSNNCVYGSIAEVYPADKDPNVVIADPQFENPEQAKEPPMGSFSNGKVTIGVPDGFKLKSTSPCIDAGRDYPEVPTKDNIPDKVAGNFTKVKSDLEGVTTQITIENKDYFGNTAPYNDGTNPAIVDIGAAEYQGAAEQATSAEKDYLKKLIKKIESYDQEEFVDSTYAPIPQLLEYAKKVSDNEKATSVAVNGAAKTLEDAIAGLVRMDMVREDSGNVITEPKNNGFEADEASDWGAWPTTAQVAISTDQKHNGEKSLKVDDGTTAENETVFAELGNVYIEPGENYLCTAWVYCGPDDISKVTVGAKYHKNNTYNQKDIKLGEGHPSTKVEEVQTKAKKALKDGDGGDGWRRTEFVFTTKKAEDPNIKEDKISLVLSSGTDTVYLDDVKVVKYSVKEGVDKSSLKTVITDSTPEYDESMYTAESYKAYMEALNEAKLAAADIMATKEQVDTAEKNLKSAFAGLVLQDTANKAELQKVYDQYKELKQGNYTDASWKTFTDALNEADRVLKLEDASTDTIASALSGLESAYAGLTEKGDKTALNEAYKKYSAYDEKQYTAESWKAFADALKNAKQVLDDKNADQTTVDSALNLLEEKAGLLKKAGSSEIIQGSGDGNNDKGGQGADNGPGDGSTRNTGNGSGNSSGNGSGNKATVSGAVKTGDDSPVIPFILLLAVSGGAAAGAVYGVRKQGQRRRRK